MSIKKIIFVSCCMYIVQILGCQPTDQRCGNYGRKLSKKASFRVDPNRNQQQRQDAWEWSLAKRAQKTNSPETERAILEYYQAYGRTLTSKTLGSENGSGQEARYFHINCSRPLTAVVFATMLLLAPRATAAHRWFGTFEEEHPEGSKTILPGAIAEQASYDEILQYVITNKLEEFDRKKAELNDRIEEYTKRMLLGTVNNTNTI